MRLRLMLAALGAALLMPASASAYMTIGPPLTGLSRVAPPCTYGGCSIVHQSHTGNEVTWPVQGNPLDPIHGVIVRWRVVGQGKFQLFPGSYVDSAMNVFRRGKATTIQVGTSNTQPTTFAARTRIAPGQHIGLTLHPGATLAMVNETSTRADSWRPALPFDLPVIAEATHPLRAGFQAVVEFDRDKDGYGSPSQDACDTDKLTIGPCDKPPVPPEPEPDEPAPIPPAPTPPHPPTPAPVPPSPVPSPTLDRTAPVFAGAASIAPRRFRARRGARLSFTLSEAARVRLSLARRTSRKRYRRVIAVTRELPQGASSIRLGRRVGGKRLRRGRYRATLRAVDAAGNKSAPVRVRFRVR